MSSNNLNNIDLQIVIKYIYDFKTINNLLQLNNMLKYNYHTTFEIINLNCYYALTDKQVKEIIDKLTTIFPNLEEIILNFNGCSMIDFDDFINYILLNYLKFCKFSNLSIKIQFDFKIRFYNIPYADINF